MAEEKQQNPKWKRQAEALKKVQLTFELMAPIDQRIRMEAIKTGDTPSNVVRKTLGLDTKPPVRPRLGVSMSADDLQALAERYQVDPTDRKQLVRRATEQIQLHFKDALNKDNSKE